MAAKPRSPAPQSRSKRAISAVVPTDAVFTIDELAVYLKLPKRTLYKLAQEAAIPAQKVGKHWRFRRETIDRWLDHGECSGA